MSKNFNTAGKSTREMADKRRKQGILTGLIVIFILVVVYLLLTNSQQLGLGGGVILILLILLRIVPDWFDGYSRRQTKMVRRAERGAVAEEKVGGLLDGLGDDFIVLHDVTSPYGNIDHVVVSRHGGLILLETKSHHGEITAGESDVLVNGHSPEKNFVTQALQNSYWLRQEAASILGFKPWITAMLVFTNGFVKVSRPIKGVRVVNGKYLIPALQSIEARQGDKELVWAKREGLKQLLLQ